MKLILEMEKEQKTKEDSGIVGAMDMIGMYGQSATIHGVSKVAAPQIYQFRRSLWMLLLLGMAVGLSIVVYLQFQRFKEYPTVTMVNADFHDELPFPSVTICNINQYHRDRLPVSQKVYTLLYNLSEFSEIRSYLDKVDNDKQCLEEVTEYTGDLLYSIAMEAAHSLKEMFLLCTWRGREVACDEVFESVITNIGVCYRFNGNASSHMVAKNTGPLSGLRVILDIQQNFSFFSDTSQSGIKVLVNEPNEAPILRNNGWFVRPGTSTAIGIRKEELFGLKKPYKAFGTSYCYDTEIEGFETPLKRHANYSYTRKACREECYMNYLFNKCQCRHYFSPGEEDYCSMEQYNDCYLNALKGTDLTDVIEKCNTCPSRCHAVGYIPNLSAADFASTFIIDYMLKTNMIKEKDYVRKNVIDLRVFYDSLTVTKTQQKPELTVQGIMADLGGLMGMFLGASLLSLTELVEFLALLALGFYHKRRQQKLSRSKEEICNKMDDVTT